MFSIVYKVCLFLLIPIIGFSAYKEGEVLVKIKEGRNVSSLNISGILSSEYLFDSTYKLVFKDRAVPDVISELSKNPDIVYAEPNYIRQICVTTNDPGTLSQWALPKIKAFDAWDIATGTEDIIIAVIDTGVDYGHPDLENKVIKGYDYGNGDSDPMDTQGHGTHVAGIAGAKTNNGIGIAGLGWNCKVLAVKVFPDNSNYTDDGKVIQGINYAANYPGVKVINMSLGDTKDSQALKDACDSAYNKGVFIVAAAGNNNLAPIPFICYPAAYDNVMAVAATNNIDQKTGFSNYGDRVDIAAPGEDIYSTVRNNGYGYMDGTSMASPFVAGLAGLIFSKNPSWNNYQVARAIKENVDNIGVSGIGGGRINAKKSLNFNISTKTWTFIVYLDGDNNLEADAIDDFLEMASIGSNDNINIVVQFDRISGYDSQYGNWTGTKRFYITKDMDPVPGSATDDIGEENMGDLNTLKSFIQWAKSSYPAENYSLILWDHGSGWKTKTLEERRPKAICYDDTSNGDSLTLKELRNALSSIGKIDLIGFDACLMAMAEVAHQIKDCGDIMVASEDEEPDNGWDYEAILSELVGFPTMTAGELGRKIVKSYVAFYPNEKEITLSVIDLSAMGSLATSIGSITTINDWSRINTARNNTLFINWDKSYIDLFDFANKLGTISLTSPILFESHTTSSKNYSGLSIYFPTEDDGYLGSYTSTNLLFAEDTGWDEFILKFLYPPSGPVTVSNASGGFVGNYTTIQAGVQICPIGGTVSVFAGAYTEAVYINKGIALIGVGTPTITTFGLGDTNTVTFDGNGADDSLIFGFTITGASGEGLYGSGIYCNNGSPTITNNIITENSYCGIYCYYHSSPTITNNIISKNNAHGIFCYYSSPTIYNNTISENAVSIYCDYYSSPTIYNNIITENSYCGISCNNSSSPIITNNTITENNWHGVYCWNSCFPKIYNNIIAQNGVLKSYYWGIYSDNSTPTINHNNVWGNGLVGTNNYSNCSAGLNDISLDPQFISPSDFRLKPTSLCIDKGTNTVLGGLPATDKEGNPRILRIVDIGAYEFQGSFLQIRFLSGTSNYSGSEVTISGNTSGTNTVIAIDFGAHKTIATTISSEYGTFSATFIIDNQPLGTKVITARDKLNCFATTIFVIIHGVPVKLVIAPATANLTADGSLTLMAIAHDNNSNTWTITSQTSFTEDDPQGTMSDNIYYPGMVGTWTITGTTTNGIMATATVNVSAGAYINLKVVSPLPPATTTTNTPFTLTITLHDRDDNPYTGTVFMTNTTKSIFPCIITITGGTGTATCTISQSPSGGTDTITVYTNIAQATAEIVVFISSQQGGTVTDKGATIVFGTLSTNVIVNIATSTIPPANPPEAIKFIGTVYDIELINEQGDKTGTQAGQMGTVTLRLVYPDVNQDGLVDGTNIRELDLIIYHFESGSGIWKALNTKVVTETNVALAYILHFSTFTLGGTPTYPEMLAKPTVFPNPFIWNKHSYITFGDPNIVEKRLLQYGNIRIYNIVCELITELSIRPEDNGQKIWYPKEKGLASGVYIYVIEAQRKRAIGKIGIIK